MNEYRFRELDQEWGRIEDRKRMNETRCEECGMPVEDDMCLCYVCAQRNDEAEYEANEIRSASRTEDE